MSSSFLSQGWSFSRRLPSSRNECVINWPIEFERGDWLAPKFFPIRHFRDARHVFLHVSPLSLPRFWLSVWQQKEKEKKCLSILVRLLIFLFLPFFLSLLRNVYFVTTYKFCNQALHIVRTYLTIWSNQQWPATTSRN